MTDLTAHLQDYLRLRRSLGFKLEDPGRVLPQFVVFLEAHGAETITTELAITWAQLPQEVQPRRWAHRLGAVRGFARYLQTIDPSTEIPPDDVFGARQQRPAPYLSSEHRHQAPARGHPPAPSGTMGGDVRNALRPPRCIRDADGRGPQAWPKGRRLCLEGDHHWGGEVRPVPAHPAP